MPKIDPETGCEVMTFFEFLGAEAKREGKDPADIMDEIAQATAEDNANQEEFYRQPEEALKVLKEWVEEDEQWEDDPDMHKPEEVLEILDVRYGGGYSGSKLFILARTRCSDGKERIAEYHYQYWSGSRMEPPDEDGELLWHDSVEDYHHDLERREREKREREQRYAEARAKRLAQQRV